MATYSSNDSSDNMTRATNDDPNAGLSTDAKNDIPTSLHSAKDASIYGNTKDRDKTNREGDEHVDYIFEPIGNYVKVPLHSQSSSDEEKPPVLENSEERSIPEVPTSISVDEATTTDKVNNNNSDNISVPSQHQEPSQPQPRQSVDKAYEIAKEIVISEESFLDILKLLNEDYRSHVIGYFNKGMELDKMIPMPEFERILTFLQGKRTSTSLLVFFPMFFLSFFLCFFVSSFVSLFLGFFLHVFVSLFVSLFLSFCLFVFLSFGLSFFWSFF